MGEKLYTGRIGACPKCGGPLKEYTRRFMVFNKIGAECSECGYSYERSQSET